jgi:membrane-bound metal-dependent hydrolase YbcI (DUF457 family)
MKGLTHFSSGVALGSFFMPAVAAAASTRLGTPEAASSFILALGGLYGIMPDTLDFKFGRFFVQEDYTLEFDLWDPDPQDMARQIGEAIDEVGITGQYIQMQFNPMRVGSNLWRQYVVKFDGETNEVIVVINGIVSTSQVSYPGTEPPEEKRVGRYKLKHAKLLEKHGRPSVIDIMSGPMFGFRDVEENGERYTAIEFLPWHRTWSHSYVLGFFLSIPVWIIAWFFSFNHWFLYGLIAFLGYAIHITEDLTGHMGGSLIWPFSEKRYDGFCWFKASDPRANFSVDYLCFTILIFNLDRFSTHVISMDWYSYFFYFFIIPMVFYFTIFGYFMEKPAKEGAVIAESLIAKQKALEAEEALFEEEGL